jgi:hypothetical protein
MLTSNSRVERNVGDACLALTKANIGDNTGGENLRIAEFACALAISLSYR